MEEKEIKPENTGKPEGAPKKTTKKFLFTYSIALLTFAVILLVISYMSTLNMNKSISGKLDEGFDAQERYNELTEKNDEYLRKNNELRDELDDLKEKNEEFTKRIAELEEKGSTEDQKADALENYTKILEVFISGEKEVAENLLKDFNGEDFLNNESKQILAKIRDELGKNK